MAIKKTLMAAGLGMLCMADAAEAQDLSLYGVVDTGLAWTRLSGKGSQTGVLGAGQTDSLWGLRGTEEIGTRTRATFSLESGFDPATGSLTEERRLFNYGAWVGLAHDDLGELRLGRQRMVAQQFGNVLEIAGWKSFGLGATLKASDEYQFSNVVTYLSPTLHGWQAGTSYSFSASENAGFPTRENTRASSSGVRFEEGPFYATLTHDRLWTGLPGAQAPRSPRAWQAGASYDFDVVKVALGWSRQQNGYVGLNGADFTPAGATGVALAGLGPAELVDGGHIDAWYVGASIPWGHGSLMAQASLAQPNWTWRQTGKRARQSQVYTVGYAYPLSKRTSLYAYAGRMHNQDLEDGVAADNPQVARVGAGLTHYF